MTFLERVAAAVLRGMGCCACMRCVREDIETRNVVKRWQALKLRAVADRRGHA